MTWNASYSSLVPLLIVSSLILQIESFPIVEKRCAVCVAMVDEILHNLMKEQPHADIPIGDQVRDVFFFRVS